MLLKQAQNLLSLVLIVAGSGPLLLPLFFLAQIAEKVNIFDQLPDASYLLLSHLLLAELGERDDLVLQPWGKRGVTVGEVGLGSRSAVGAGVVGFRGLDDLGEEIALDDLGGGMQMVGDALVHLSKGLPESGVIVVLDGVVGPS